MSACLVYIINKFKTSEMAYCVHKSKDLYEDGYGTCLFNSVWAL